MSALKEIGRYGSVGVEFVVTLGIGFFVGRWLDRRFATGGALAWAGLIGGIVVGFYMLVVTAKRIQHLMEKDDDAEAKAEAERAALAKASTPQPPGDDDGPSNVGGDEPPPDAR